MYNTRNAKILFILEKFIFGWTPPKTQSTFIIPYLVYGFLRPRFLYCVFPHTTLQLQCSQYKDIWVYFAFLEIFTKNELFQMTKWVMCMLSQDSRLHIRANRLTARSMVIPQKHLFLDFVSKLHKLSHL